MWKRVLILAMVVIGWTGSPLFSQPRADGDPGSPTLEDSATSVAFDVDAATQAYLSRVSPEARQRADEYFKGGYWLKLWNFLFGLMVAWILLSTRLSAKMRDWGERVGRWQFVHTFLYGVQYFLVTAVVGFPLLTYETHLRERAYELTFQSFGDWLDDRMMGTLVGLVITPLSLLVLYAVFRKAPRTWWLWGSLAALGMLVILLFISPVFISPLFNDYQPLEEPNVVEPILSMARSNGVPVDRIYQYDASKQSQRISANVSGIFGTMRIALNDNLLERCDLAGVKLVMGHEIAHYTLNHAYEAFLFVGLLLVLAFAFVRFGFDRLVRWRGRQWGISGIGDVAGWPLLTALLSVYFFLMTPLTNTFIRVNEAEADLYGLNIAREPDAMAEVALMMAEYRKLDPGPLEEWVFFDHPSGRARIRMAMQWKAENLAN